MGMFGARRFADRAFGDAAPAGDGVGGDAATVEGTATVAFGTLTVTADGLSREFGSADATFGTLTVTADGLSREFGSADATFATLNMAARGYDTTVTPAFGWSIIFEVAFDVDPGDEPLGSDWTDLSDRLRHNGIDLATGAGRLVGGGEGFCSLTLDNLDRAIDPTNPSATYNLVPMRHARLRARIGSTTYPLFRGYVDAWPSTWSEVDSTVAVELVDAFAWLALQDVNVDRAAELTSARIGGLLDQAGWSGGLRNIDTGIKSVQALEQNGANLLRLIMDAADAEDGDVFVDPAGRFTFQSRHARLTDTSDVTFGTGGVAITAASPQFDTAELTNSVRVELADRSSYDYTDTASVTAYGPRTATIRDLLLGGPEAEALAQWDVVRFKDPHVWLDQLTTNGRIPGTLAAVLDLRVGDIAQVEYTPPAGGAVSDQFGIDRIGHRIGIDTWVTLFDLSPHFGSGPWLTLDDPTTGLLDGTNKLAP